MCGIVGYVGSRQVAPLLLEGLAKLEYRGYDSAGLAVRYGTRPSASWNVSPIKSMAAGRCLGAGASDTPAGRPMGSPI